MSDQLGNTRLKPPFPYFGGKGRAAGTVWDALGDPGGYVEPFAGSAAVLLARPKTRARRVETINDFDGWLVNMWRAVRDKPGEVAEHADGPVTEIDYHARLAWLQERRADGLRSWLEGDPEASDAKAAGWWLYVVSCGLGDPWEKGPWRVVDGRFVNSRVLPHLGDAGRGVKRVLPHLGDAGTALVQYMRALALRLSDVRITAGDWRRVLTPSVCNATAGNRAKAIFLDPPYATSGDLYAVTKTGDAHETISEEVREWCIGSGAGYRIVLCGYEDEHDVLLEHGWRVKKGKPGGSGYNTDKESVRRERLWLSPECVEAQMSFDLGV